MRMSETIADQMDSNENKQHVDLCKSSGHPRGILAANWQNTRAMNEARPQSKCSRTVPDDRVFHSALPPMVSARPYRAYNGSGIAGNFRQAKRRFVLGKRAKTALFDLSEKYVQKSTAVD